MTIRTLTVMGVLSAALWGCDGDKPPKTAADTAHPSGLYGTTRTDESPKESRLEIDPQIAKLCDLPTAHFAYDSAAVDPQVTQALDALATCFITGRAKGRSMNIVGHADPRGELEYNLGLGHRRAGTIAGYLADKGLAQAQVNSSSRGALDATGTDEQSWAQDRKVEILLADDAPEPTVAEGI